MKEENPSTCITRATAVCEEFCRYVVVDSRSSSILVNVKTDYFHELQKRLGHLDYVDVFVASVNPARTVTATFVWAG